ncbi:MAG TPA: tetratricopeptide repeat protein [Candidatus Hydrogenedentes bacterium]|nr:tetratricopeptide repeat protein [Candidatus Hydrogenedentota bacterium]HPG67716.1 tetratricopeptide repeat protein [Candidatus Hydrogenedentota bacterium]
MAVSKPKKKAFDEIEQTEKKSDWQALVTYIQENPVLSAVAAAFIVLCVVAGLIFRAGREASARDVATRYAKALSNEDPALRASELAPVAEASGKWTAEALYMLGESAYAAKDYEKAKETFTKLRETFPAAPFVADAVEGLGNIAENAGSYEEALALYQEIVEKWPTSFAAMRQDLNIGRCQERLDRYAEAIEAYKRQLDQFPDSGTASEAQQALDVLQLTHPDLFPEETPQEETAEGQTPEQPLAVGEPTEAVPTPTVAPAETPAATDSTPATDPAAQPAPEEPAPDTAPEASAAEAAPEQSTVAP